jgi:hypothetical protein
VRVSLGLGKKSLLKEDKTSRDILKKTDLQELSQSQGETLHYDMQRIRPLMNSLNKRGELGDRIRHIPEENERPPPGLWRLPRARRDVEIVEKITEWILAYKRTLGTDSIPFMAQLQGMPIEQGLEVRGLKQIFQAMTTFAEEGGAG